LAVNAEQQLREQQQKSCLLFQSRQSINLSPYHLSSLLLRNRIAILLMCQYSAEQGKATKSHIINLGDLAASEGKPAYAHVR
jgi:hypothetical protein